MELTDVSKTAFVTLRSHVIESQNRNPIIKDSMAVYCLDKLISLATENENRLLFKRKLPATLTSHIAIRARKYDSMINAYIANNPSCTVVNLGCGFDTRYWRIDNQKCKYIELDLPELVAIKKEILKEHIDYEIIGCSVLDPSWINKVISTGNKNILLIAEGLLMYLSKGDVINLFKIISEKLYNSQIIFEVVTEKYTHGFWKKILEIKMNRTLGLNAGSSYNFGIKKAQDIEFYGKGFKIIKEWSYLEDDDVRPKILKYLRRFKFITRTQWTLIASIN